ncbi:Tma19p [Sugiyamaella lignohabitans]|uniref:Translationally-controlled tumor protein homolog n=1 Tax=Sugiyamaella lignohabitans TaxID=796027 RepID=A0A167D9E7_9ASCO|nr:Tma19p [Sugiyamaella lignohabitans]ANB12643.1 Tma19p [Sugiyamaella lignohabitans]
MSVILIEFILTKTQLVSDVYDIKEVDGVVYEVDSAVITVKAGADVDIGANPSAEDGEEALEDGAEQVNNIVYSFRLQQTSFDKKSYVTYIKGYMKAVKAHLEKTNPDEVAVFEKGAAAYVKKIIANFKDYDFYTGESMNPDGMVLLLNYREDGVTPYFVVWKHGIKEEKV